MNLVAYGIEISDIVIGALNFCQCGPRVGFAGFIPSVFQVLWAPLTIKILVLNSSDLR